MDSNKQHFKITEIQKPSIKERIFFAIAMIFVFIFPLSLLICFRVVKQYKRAVIMRFGKIRADSPAGPGIIWVIPCTDDVIFIDIRTQSFDLQPREYLTKDSVTVSLDAVVYFHVSDPLRCLLNVEFHRDTTEFLTTAILTNILGKYTLTDILGRREIMSSEIRREIHKGTFYWGVDIERVEIKDIILPFDLQKAMAAEAEGSRIAKAKIIEAEGEIKTAENLKEASQLMLKQPEAMLLRYLQTLNTISSQQSTSILFPFPIEITELPSGGVYTHVPSERMETPESSKTSDKIDDTTVILNPSSAPKRISIEKDDSGSFNHTE